jgi:NitT/TauT family transport system substrate-binding protein
VTTHSLRGKTVGVEVGSVGLYLLLKALEKGSMSVSDVKLKASNQDEMLDGLRSGGLDAIVSYLPYSLRIKESLKVHSIFSSNDVPGQILDVLAASQRFIDDRPESIRGVVRAFDAAVTDAIQPGSPGMAVMAQRHGVSESSYRQSFKDGMVMIPFDEQHGRYFANGALQSLAQSMADALIKAGQLSPSVKVHDVARWLF